MRAFPWLRLAENFPSILFLTLWRLDVGMTAAGWTGALLAWGVLLALIVRNQKPDTILIGINLHFALAAPLIHLTYLFGAEDLAETMLDWVGVAVLIVIIQAGIVQHVWRVNGFAGCGARASWVLILAAFVALGWSIAFQGEQFLSVGLPILSLFIFRRWLQHHTTPHLI